MGGFLSALIIGTLLQVALGWASANVPQVTELLASLGSNSGLISTGVVALITGLIFAFAARPGLIMGLIFGAIVGALSGILGFIGTMLIAGGALPADGAAWQAYFQTLLPLPIAAIAGGGALGGAIGGLLGGSD